MSSVRNGRPLRGASEKDARTNAGQHQKNQGGVQEWAKSEGG